MPSYNLIIYIIIALASVLYFSMNAYAALRYRGKRRTDATQHQTREVTALIPVYNEDPGVFKACISSIRSEGVRFVVIGDSSLEPYKSITLENGGTFIHNKKRTGKRGALSTGIKGIETEFVLLVDSDTTIPEGAVSKLLSKFDHKVGGVGTSARVRMDGENIVSYMAEFFNRIRDTTYKTMSYFNTAMVLSGWCVMYRTQVIKPFMESKEYTEHSVLGMKSMLADDRHATCYVARSGYKVLIDYDVVVTTEGPKTVRGLTKQIIRWSRAGYLYFFKEILDGTYLKKGAFYSFQMAYMYLLPLLLIPLTLSRMGLAARVGLWNSMLFYLRGPIDILTLSFSNHHALAIVYYILQIASVCALAAFVYAISTSMYRKKRKTLLAGGLVMLMTAVLSIYGLLTMMRQNNWATR